MNQKLPKVFANKIDKYINNNQEYMKSKNEEKIKTEEKSIYQKINEIFSSYKYVYKADVVILTDKGEITKRIIGRNKKSIITIDNEIIDINKIKDIRLK